MKEYIERGKLIGDILHALLVVPSEDFLLPPEKDILRMIKSEPAADVRPVVFCRDCVNYVESEEANGEKMCVRGADWSVEDGCYYGFTEYPSPDWFCADGKKREES